MHSAVGKLIGAPGTGKLGIATSKKIGCHARRNRLKRQGREAARRAEIDPRIDYVLSLSDRKDFRQMQIEIPAMFVAMKGKWASELESF